MIPISLNMNVYLFFKSHPLKFIFPINSIFIPRMLTLCVYQVTTEHVLCARCYAKHWRYRNEVPIVGSLSRKGDVTGVRGTLE